MNKPSIEKIKTDVLVIGGGAAGLTAALEARSKNVDVTIVSKSKVGRSGNSIKSGTGMAILAPDPDSKDAFEIFRNDTISSGKEVNDYDMIDLYLAGSQKIIAKLVSWGVTFRKLGDRYMIKKAPGHSVARYFSADFSNYPFLTKGLSLTIPLLKTAIKCGVSIINYTPIIKLLVSDGCIAGAVGINKTTGKNFIFQCRVVILAAGGGGMIYARSNNTFDITGNSYALAYEAGAILRDMEFVQFHPTVMFSPIKANIPSPLFGEGAFLLNAHGERFMENYDNAGDMATRDVMSRAIFDEIMAGRGLQGSIFMDCRDLPIETFTSRYGELLRLLSKVNINPSKDLLPISPATHFFMGGIAIDKRCETSISGLLSCGESVGGLHGANRLAGNALSETFVFGMIAGNHAAWLSELGSIPNTPKYDVELFSPGDLSVTEMKRTIRNSTWKYLSIIRDQKSIEQLILTINGISASMANVCIDTIHEIVSFYELKNMVTTARMIAAGALNRGESRGAHFRSDYPEINDLSFKGNFYLKNVNGQIDIQFKPIVS